VKNRLWGLKGAEAGVPVKEPCRRIGISDATCYHWKAKNGGLEVNEALRLRQLEDENGRLKRIVAQQALACWKGCPPTFGEWLRAARCHYLSGSGLGHRTRLKGPFRWKD
jgi:putative transposase